MKTECIRLDPTRGDVTLTTYLLQDSPELLAECIRLDPTRGDVTLTTYLLQDSPELLAGKKRPAITGCPTGFFVEAAEDSICLALPRERYAAQLHQDLRFLHWLLKEMTEKFIHGMGVEIAPATLEKKVLQFFEKETAGEISAVETLLFQLRCGRRELQRPARAAACSEEAVRRRTARAPRQGALPPDGAEWESCRPGRPGAWTITGYAAIIQAKVRKPKRRFRQQRGEKA